ncbi:MAG: hypothetical protein K0R96_1766 [Pantoea agglomerans]|nr:hypothetical protein [Pantoea agglomerans]
MLSSRTLSLTIPRHWLDLYETIWKHPMAIAGVLKAPRAM